MLLPICLRVRRMGLDKIEKEWDLLSSCFEEEVAL
jgi:hypothetical protein